MTGPMVIGRENADITIHDAEISGRHAEVRLSGADLEIEDLGSTNGTFVNGERIQGEVVLDPGDVIKVGTTELAVDAPPGAAAAAAGGGGTAVSQRPDFASSGPGDTAPHTSPSGPPAGAPVEPPSPVPSGIEPGTAAITPPAGGAYVPPQADPYTPPQAGAAYTPPPGQGGQGPVPGGGQPPYGGPSPGPSWGSGGYGGGPGQGGPGGYGGPGKGKNKTGLIIGLAAGALVLIALLVFLVLKPFDSDNGGDGPTPQDTPTVSDEELIREAAIAVGANLDSPVACEYFTQRYLEESYGETGEAAIEACEADVQDPVTITVQSVEIVGDTATVEAESDGEPITLEMVKQDGEWLIDGIS